MNEIIAEEKLVKIWAIVDPNDQAAVRFMQHLGFGLAKHVYEKKIGGR